MTCVATRSISSPLALMLSSVILIRNPSMVGVQEKGLRHVDRNPKG